MIRKTLRSLRLRLRCGGLTSLELLQKRAMLIRAASLLVASQEAGENDDENDCILEVAAFHFLRKYLLKFRTMPVELHTFHHLPEVTYELFADDDCWLDLRFRKCDIPSLMEVFQIPLTITFANRATISGKQAFTIFLYRFSYHHRLSDMEVIFGKDNSILSRCFNYIVTSIYERFSFLLHDNLSYFADRFELYNQAIKRKILIESEGYLPTVSQTTALFIDTKKVKTARPATRHCPFIQRSIYNGEDRIHCFKIFAASAPDGMICFTGVPVAGRRHDSEVLKKSNFHSKLKQSQEHDVDQYIAYGDKAFPNLTHVKAAKKSRFRTAQEKRDNYLMSHQRIGVEWGFRKVVEEEKFIDLYKGMKIQLSQVGKFFLVACLLTNAHTCLYGNEANTYWKTTPPRLFDYFQCH